MNIIIKMPKLNKFLNVWECSIEFVNEDCSLQSFCLYRGKTEKEARNELDDDVNELIDTII